MISDIISCVTIVNWLLGRYIERWKKKRWFPVSDERLEKAQRTYQRFGRWSLLLSWAPVIGDPLTLLAGVMREPFMRFAVLVTIAELGRYLVLVAVTASFVWTAFTGRSPFVLPTRPPERRRRTLGSTKARTATGFAEPAATPFSKV
ncbi:DedA family protein [Caballeronia sp. EK]|nr:YqaA family protein [Caballeronia sp. EK]MBC8642005.1 DedA family protein [Caballeronia sp. EK]